MGITKVNEADLSQHLQRQGEQSALVKRLLVGQQRMLSLRQAAIYAGISENRLTRFALVEEIPYCRQEDETIYFDEGELVEWLKRNRRRIVGRRHTTALRQQVDNAYMLWEQR